MVTKVKGNGTSTFNGNVDVTGNVITDAPAFSAYMSSPQLSISSSTWTKVTVSVENFDTTSDYDTTNYRFTPSVAGYYQVNAKILFAGGAFTYGIAGLYKNGTRFSEGSYISTSSGEVGSVVNDMVYCNGTTDYLELYGTVTISSGSVGIYGNTASQTKFSAFLARAV